MVDTSNSVVSVNTDGQIAGGGSGAIAKLNEDFDSFLTLLTTQLRNQDPTDPVDTAEFTNQLVQFASVEQLIQQSELFKDMLASQEKAQSLATVNYIGTRVEVPSAQADLFDGLARWSYRPAAEAADIVLQVVDANDGSIINTFQGETGATTHTAVWDGEAADGTTAPDGRYFLRVAAVDDAGEQINVTIKSLGQVTGVTYPPEGDPRLVVYDQEFPLSEVSAVTL